jgi:Ca2+-transporting ATPase
MRRNTQMGRIGASLAGIDSGQTPLQRQLGRLVRQFGWVAIALSALLVLGYGLLRGQWLQGLLSALAFAMAMLPEEIPMVMTVFIGLAAWRMARVKVLARRPAVVEALGAATVLCVDKTGTLTENRQKLRRLVTDTADVDLTQGGPVPEEVHALLEYGVMASRRGSADPLDAAVVAGGDRSLQGTEHLHPQWLLEKEYPLTPELLAMSQAWTRPDGSREVAARAPRGVADLCYPTRRTDRLLQQGARAGRGLRVLAVARGRTAAGQPARRRSSTTTTSNCSG